MTGCGWQGESALEAWQRNQAGAVSEQVPGVAVYFGASADNEHYGHTGICVAPDEFVSVTNAGVKRYSISYWNAISAPLLGYIQYWG